MVEPTAKDCIAQHRFAAEKGLKAPVGEDSLARTMMVGMAAVLSGAGDGDDAPHELAAFLQQSQAEIASEYDRIYQRSAEDPGTAGDGGEKNWAKLLRDWLPPNYQVVTKGRVLFPDRSASPQIDVLVLRGYPPRLLDKEVYLSSGVAAAFECKNTLKASHITKAAETAALLKSKTYSRTGTVLAELQSPPVFGLLAHSHSWTAESSTPFANVDQKVFEVLNRSSHPSTLIDLICVADLATWTLTHNAVCPWHFPELRRRAGRRQDGGVHTGYIRYGPEIEGGQPPNPVALLIAQMFTRLGWEDPNIRPLADYFSSAGFISSGAISPRKFGLDVFSPEVQQYLRQHVYSSRVRSLWDPWQLMIGFGTSY